MAEEEYSHCCSIFSMKTNPQPSKINNVIKVNISYKYTLLGKGTKGTKKLLQRLVPTLFKSCCIPKYIYGSGTIPFPGQ